MTLFLDTSALVKMYVDEPGSEDVQVWVAGADEVSCQWLAYVEARSAFAAKARIGELTETELAECKSDFEQDWTRFHRTPVTDALLRRSGALSEQLGTRAYDSVHLASAEHLQAVLGEAVTFGTFDFRQAVAATQLGLIVLPGRETPSPGQ